MEHILTDITASISELKANPMQVIHEAGGEPLAILNRNKPAFYCIDPELYAQMMDLLDDMMLSKLAQARAGEKEVPVALSDL